MLRTHSFGLATCALLVVTCSLNTAHAQRGGGGGMRMQSVSRVQLATLPEVESDTKLTADQKSLAKSLREKLDAKRAELMGGGGGGGGPNQEARQQLTKMTSELDNEFVAKLDDAQKKRFSGLLLQVNGVSAVLDSNISKELGLGEESVKKLQQVNQENQTARREAMQGGGGGNREEMMAKMRELNEKADNALLAVLSDAEKKKMEELKGSKLEIDTAPLRPRRPQQ